MNEPTKLFSIGAFANLTRLSIKALRLYDQLGLLQPYHIDPQSGYRYYEIEQLSNARMIRNLRDMDMPLATIRRVLAVSPVSVAQVESLVQQYLEMRERQVEQIRLLAHQFTEQLKEVVSKDIPQMMDEKEKTMTIEVNVKAIPTQQVLSFTCKTKVDQLDKIIGDTLYAMQNTLKEQGLEAVAAPFGIFHGPINQQEDGPLEICLPVNGTVTAKDDVVVKQLSGGDAACVVMLGADCDFPAIVGAYDSAADWINKNGYTMAEPPREVWHSAPGQDAKMEIVWLFNK